MKDKKESIIVKPIYKKLLIAAIVIYIIGSCIIHTDLYYKVSKIEHELCHTSYEHH